VHIRVEDVSHVDASAQLLGEKVFDKIHQNQLIEGKLAFEVTVKEPSEGASCAIWVHLDVDRDGVISAGDYVSTENIPVLEDAGLSPVRIRVSRVG
jgi:hypothetical protein